jgi:hypothetical protein
MTASSLSKNTNTNTKYNTKVITTEPDLVMVVKYFSVDKQS